MELYTTHGFSWENMLQKTSMKLKLTTDINMNLLFEGGISQCNHKYFKANNK